MWMSGYGARSEPADGKIHNLYARVACLKPDHESPAFLFVSLDLVGVPVKMAETLSADFAKSYGIPRENIMFACSHTHCGPALDHDLSWMLAMDKKDWQQVHEYQKWLNDRIRSAVKTAVADLKPAVLHYGTGTCGFANNRRPPIGEGPIDHSVPVLRISNLKGTIRGLIFGYACHNTTLGIQQWCGDYAGFAQLNLEDTYPDAVAMFFTGCGADQNPLPRRTMELCEKYGRLLSVSVQEVVKNEMTPLAPAMSATFKTIPLEFATAPTREQIEDKLNNGDRYDQNWAKNQLQDLEDDRRIEMIYPFPVQSWRLGDQLTWIALGGEVVVDYSLRLKKQLGEKTTWVTGYANDVMCYIPSERVLKEGGYEGATSMRYYQKPSVWKAGLEDKIIDQVMTQVESLQSR
ncbi:MAG: neutral/alkaline non-lysosomal ceramidase N-terminal domain-containing protein [Planctomycetaceae bacterium]|nr:neutral/alkaline non-lysosomal ceramidase N-terminal domain-containing protein [Planctomycetaceae bacterium]